MFKNPHFCIQGNATKRSLSPIGAAISNRQIFLDIRPVSIASGTSVFHREIYWKFRSLTSWYIFSDWLFFWTWTLNRGNWFTFYRWKKLYYLKPAKISTDLFTLIKIKFLNNLIIYVLDGFLRRWWRCKWYDSIWLFPWNNRLFFGMSYFQQ